MISLYTATVPAFAQIVAATGKLLAKADAFAAERGIDPATLVDARLAPDMLPFAYQVKSVANHSVGAIAGVRAGIYAPDRGAFPPDLAAMRALMDETAATLAGYAPDEIDALAGAPVEFVFGERRVPYVAEDFLLSFSLPNFYFHASIAYGLLRSAGMPLGKLDYIGRPRFKA